jgi:hypothetical protein
LPKAELARLEAIDALNATLLKRVASFSVALPSGSAASITDPVKVSVDVSGCSAAQKARLTGVIYDKAAKGLKQLGGELSEDGKTFTFSSSKQGLIGLIVSDSVTKLQFTIGSKAYSANGKQSQTDAAPFAEAGKSVMIPLRALVDALGAEISWVEGARVVVIASAGKTVRIAIGQPLISGAQAPEIRGDRAFAPLEHIAFALGANVVLIGDTVRIYV